MNILCIGDVFGKPGRRAISELLPKIIAEEGVDFVIVNGENAAGGKGITDKIAEELSKSPIDVITAGNHIWEHDSLHPYFTTHQILRPLNVVGHLPGRGWLVATAKNKARIGVICVQGNIFMDDKGTKVESPFKRIKEAIAEVRNITTNIFIDLHAETTSEKRAMLHFIDGEVTALVGTHTHIQTSDEEVTLKGTAYITDLGMTGPHDSVIGLDKDVAIKRILTGDRRPYEVAKGGARIEGVAICFDETSGKASAIKRIRVPLVP